MENIYIFDLITINFVECILSLFVRLVTTISGKGIQSSGMFRESKLVPNEVENKISCSICENNNFRVERVEPEIILLICENCGEIHKITPEIFAHKMLYLKFNISDLKK